MVRKAVVGSESSEGEDEAGAVCGLAEGEGPGGGGTAVVFPFHPGQTAGADDHQGNAGVDGDPAGSHGDDADPNAG